MASYCEIDKKVIRSWQEIDYKIQSEALQIIVSITKSKGPYALSKCELDTVLYADLLDLIKLYRESRRAKIEDTLIIGRLVRDGKFWNVNTSKLELKGIKGISDGIYIGSDVNYCLQGIAAYFNDCFHGVTMPMLNGAYNMAQGISSAVDTTKQGMGKYYDNLMSDIPLSGKEFDYKNAKHNFRQALDNKFSNYGAQFAEDHCKIPWGVQFRGLF